MLIRGGRCSEELGCRAQPLLQPLARLLAPAAGASRPTKSHERCQEMGFEPQISPLPSLWGSAAAPSRGLPCTGIPSCRTQHFMYCTEKNSPAGDVRGDTELHVFMSSFPVDPLRGRKPIRVSCTGTRRAGDTLALPPGTGKVPSAPINQEQTAFPRAEPAGSAPSACHPHVPKRPRHQDNTSTDSFFLYIRTFISQRENIVSDSQIIVGKISICFFSLQA